MKHGDFFTQNLRCIWGVSRWKARDVRCFITHPLCAYCMYVELEFSTYYDDVTQSVYWRQTPHHFFNNACIFICLYIRIHTNMILIIKINQNQIKQEIYSAYMELLCSGIGFAVPGTEQQDKCTIIICGRSSNVFSGNIHRLCANQAIILLPK